MKFLSIFLVFSVIFLEKDANSVSDIKDAGSDASGNAPAPPSPPPKPRPKLWKQKLLNSWKELEEKRLQENQPKETTSTGENIPDEKQSVKNAPEIKTYYRKKYKTLNSITDNDTINAERDVSEEQSTCRNVSRKNVDKGKDIICTSSSEDSRCIKKKKIADLMTEPGESSKGAEGEAKRNTRCDECSITFPNVKEYVSHGENTHQGENFFRCPSKGCGKSYKRWFNLRNHESSTHRDRPKPSYGMGIKKGYICQKCKHGVKFETRAQLSYHYKMDHNGECLFRKRAVQRKC